MRFGWVAAAAACVVAAAPAEAATYYRVALDGVDNATGARISGRGKFNYFYFDPDPQVEFGGTSVYTYFFGAVMVNNEVLTGGLAFQDAESSATSFYLGNGGPLIIRDYFSPLIRYSTPSVSGVVSLSSVNFSSAFTSAPEPAAWALMIGGFGMVGGTMRRRKVSTKIAFG